MKITDPIFPPVDDEMTETAFNALNSSGNQLSSETFWDQYHEKTKRDWFMDYNTVATYLEEHTDINNPDRSNNLAILDLGCGTSTLASMMLFKYKSTSKFRLIKHFLVESTITARFKRFIEI